MAKILILNGPNLNLLGSREPAVYGTTTLQQIGDQCQDLAKTLSHDVDFFQENAEHKLIEKIHQAKNVVDFIIINPAAFTHTSVALRDALVAVEIPFIEIHLSNVHARESFRKESFLVDVAVGGIFGFGAQSYLLALRAADHYLSNNLSTHS